jgi:Ca2+-binding EF-hand superfamily protein
MKHFYLLPLLPLLPAACVQKPDPHSEAAHGRKLMGLQEKFDRFDYNADGKLTRREIEQGIKESGVTGVTNEEVQAMMENYDVNKDGGISRWETERAIDMPLPDHD